MAGTTRDRHANGGQGMKNTPRILLEAMARRATQGLKVVIRQGDGELFTYWPKTHKQKTDFIQRALKTGAVIVEQ